MSCNGTVSIGVCVWVAAPFCGLYLFQLIFPPTIEKWWRRRELQLHRCMISLSSPCHSNQPHSRNIHLHMSCRLVSPLGHTFVRQAKSQRHMTNVNGFRIVLDTSAATKWILSCLKILTLVSWKYLKQVDLNAKPEYTVSLTSVANLFSCFDKIWFQELNRQNF